MRRLLLIPVALAGALASFGVASAAHPEPGGGPEFGQHIASMAPEHAIDHGAMFGECVSSMARGEGCTHEH